MLDLIIEKNNKRARSWALEAIDFINNYFNNIIEIESNLQLDQILKEYKAMDGWFKFNNKEYSSLEGLIEIIDEDLNRWFNDCYHSLDDLHVIKYFVEEWEHGKQAIIDAYPFPNKYLHHYLANTWVDSDEIKTRIEELEQEEEEEEAK